MSRRLTVIVVFAASCHLAACTPPAADPAAPAGESIAAPARARPAAALTPAGPAAALTADTDENQQWAASVVELDPIPDQNAKLFGTAGGDPAMNGLYTHIAFFAGPAGGWAIYRIGDFLEYEVLSSAPGRVDLEISESTMDDATGDIGSRTRRIIVAWTPGPEDGPPTSVTVTPAN